jgi:hypothetical protein
MQPDASRAIVEAAKVRDYLLSAHHPIGRFKSVVFFALGYSPDQWQRLRDDLINLLVAGEIEWGEASSYGRKLTASGTLVGPNGRGGRFKTVWLIDNATSIPRLLTAYPE